MRIAVDNYWNVTRLTHDHIPDAVISIIDAAALAPSLLLPNDICVLDSTT